MNPFKFLKSLFTKQEPAPVVQPETWVTLTTIAGVPILYDPKRQILRWRAGMMIDNDGIGGNAAGDKYHQSATSYQPSLNALTVPFVVCPLSVIGLVRPFVLGCHATIRYDDKEIQAVVGDLGPRHKVGEASVKAAQMLGIPSSPVSGGIENKVVTYTIFCGQAAFVNGVAYKPQPWRG